ncbi:MAG: TonB-dependent receptor domain-containing protein, partial [Verrucomicrobiota bacterium]
GLSYYAEDFEQENLNYDPTNPFSTQFPFDDAYINRAGFLQMLVDLTPDLRVIIGGRFDQYSDFDNASTGSLSVNYELLDDQLALFAQVATAYAVPQAFDLYGTFGNPTLDPEESVHYEIGLRGQFLDERLSFSAVAFYTDLENLIVFTPSFSTDNVGQAHNEGFELSAAYDFGLAQIEADYSYVQAWDDEASQRLLRRPRHSGGITATFFPIEDVTVGVSQRFVADRVDIDGGTFARFEADDYTVGRAFATWQITELFSLSARIENLFDENYEEVDGFPAPERAYYASARLDF